MNKLGLTSILIFVTSLIASAQQNHWLIQKGNSFTGEPALILNLNNSGVQSVTSKPLQNYILEGLAEDELNNVKFFSAYDYNSAGVILDPNLSLLAQSYNWSGNRNDHQIVSLTDCDDYMIIGLTIAPTNVGAHLHFAHYQFPSVLNPVSVAGMPTQYNLFGDRFVVSKKRYDQNGNVYRYCYLLAGNASSQFRTSENCKLDQELFLIPER